MRAMGRRFMWIGQWIYGSKRDERLPSISGQEQNRLGCAAGEACLAPHTRAIALFVSLAWAIHEGIGAGRGANSANGVELLWQDGGLRDSMILHCMLHCRSIVSIQVHPPNESRRYHTRNNVLHAVHGLRLR